jgi:hypothetical protein
MANRLTDTTIWKKQKWFKKMPVLHKLAWKYLTDECNHAGVWKIDLSELLEDLGLDDFDFDAFLDCCNKDFDKKTGKGMVRQRVMKFNEDYVWVTGFMTFQYGGKTQIIKPNNNAVPSAIEILKSFKLYDLGIKMKYFQMEDKTTPSKPLKGGQSPLDPVVSPLKPLEGGKDKDIYKDKDKVDNNTLTNTNTVKAEKKTFNTRPLATDFNGLPDNYVDMAIEKVKLTKQTDIDKKIVIGIWEVFKLQKLTGDEYHANEGRVYSYFLDWLKYQNFNNGQQSINGGSGKQGTSAARTDALKKW